MLVDPAIAASSGTTMDLRDSSGPTRDDRLVRARPGRAVHVVRVSGNRIAVSGGLLQC